LVNDKLIILAFIDQHVDISTNFLNIAVLSVYNVFTERVVSVSYSLPNTVDFNSLSVFKRSIKRTNFSSHLRFNCH